MLNMEGAPAHRNKGGNSSYGKREPGRISTSSIGRFRKVLSHRDIAFMQGYARQAMLAHGYQPDPVQLSLREGIMFALIDWPTNMVRIAALHVLETMHDWTGRKPAPHTMLTNTPTPPA
jgi:hypothetical protein